VLDIKSHCLVIAFMISLRLMQSSLANHTAFGE
jgi:hypothetical protein